MEPAHHPPGGFLSAVALAGVVALAAIGLLALAPPAGSLDDVFVVLTEARAAFEPGAASAGPSAPVESCTSPADVLLKTMLLAASDGHDPLRAAGWLALLEVLIFVGLSVGLVARWVPDMRLRAVCAVGLVGSPGFLESASYRLEGPLFALVWMLVVAAAMDRAPRRAIAGGAALAWVRPEGMLLGLAATWLALGASGKGAIRWRLAGSALVLVPVSLYRWLRFQDWVPNTYRAKRSDDLLQEWMDGSVYVADLLLSPGGLALVLLALLVGRRAKEERAGGADGGFWPCTTALGLAGFALAVVVASGGDSYSGARLALPIGIPLWLGFARAGSGQGRRWMAGVVAVALQMLSLVGLGSTGAPVLERLEGAVAGPAGLEVFHPEVRALEAAEEALGGEVLAHRHLQRVRWFCPEVRVLDLTGLTDREVARTPAPGQVKFGRDAVQLALERRVGALHLDPVGVRPAPLSSADLVPSLSDPRVASRYAGPPFLSRELAEDLDAAYLGASYPVPGGHVNLLVRRDLAARFERAGFVLGSGASKGR